MLNIRLFVLMLFNCMNGVGVFSVIGCVLSVFRMRLWVCVVLVFSGIGMLNFICFSVLVSVMLCMFWVISCEFGMIIVEWFYSWILVVCMLMWWMLFFMLLRFI